MMPMIIQNAPFFDDAVFKSLLQAFEHSIFSVVITDAEAGEDGQKFLYANQNFLQQCGYSEAELLGKSPRILQGNKTDRALLESLKSRIYQNPPFIGQTINYRKDGSEYIVRWSIHPLKGAEDQLLGFVSFQMEVTELVKNKALSLMLSEALNQTADAALITDLQGNILYSNRALSRLTGYTPEELQGKNTRVFRSGKMDIAFYKHLWDTLLNNQSFDGVFLNTHKDGHFYFEHKTITPILNEEGHAMYYLAISRDTTELIHQTDYLEYQAYHDELTGIYNRAKFNEIAELKLRQFEQFGKTFSLIVGDVDHFKQINDRYGHPVGDKVLQKIADQMVNSLRKDDVVARWGGEEFCILLDTDAKSAVQVANFLREKLEKIDYSESFAAPVTLSFGVAEIQPDQTFKQLYQQADQALYQAKLAGRNCVRS